MEHSDEKGLIGVTGATGHLGQWVVSELSRNGYRVVSISRKPQHFDAIPGLNYPSNLSTLSVDLSDKESVNSCTSKLHELDAVIHLAGLSLIHI